MMLRRQAYRVVQIRLKQSPECGARFIHDFHDLWMIVEFRAKKALQFLMLLKYCVAECHQRPGLIAHGVDTINLRGSNIPFRLDDHIADEVIQCDNGISLSFSRRTAGEPYICGIVSGCF